MRKIMAEATFTKHDLSAYAWEALGLAPQSFTLREANDGATEIMAEDGTIVPSRKYGLPTKAEIVAACRRHGAIPYPLSSMVDVLAEDVRWAMPVDPSACTVYRRANPHGDDHWVAVIGGSDDDTDVVEFGIGDNGQWWTLTPSSGALRLPGDTHLPNFRPTPELCRKLGQHLAAGAYQASIMEDKKEGGRQLAQILKDERRAGMRALR